MMGGMVIGHGRERYERHGSLAVLGLLVAGSSLPSSAGSWPFMSCDYQANQIIVLRHPSPSARP